MNNIEIKSSKEDIKGAVKKIESYMIKEHYMIKHFINALNSLIFVEMDIKEWINKKEKQTKIIPYYKKGDNVILKFDANDFLINKPFPLIKYIDAYGSALYDLNGIKTILLNTYGEIKEMEKRYDNTNYVPLMPICFIYDEYVEVADIVISKKIMPRKKFFIYNHMIGIIPPKLRDIEVGGNNAFHFYPQDRIVSIKIKPNMCDKIPQIYKHLDSEDWESLPYIKMNLELLI
jgi:hypothetical protein